MAYEYGICETCGTATITDPETEARVHADITYSGCSFEPEQDELVEAIQGAHALRRPSLRVVR